MSLISRAQVEGGRGYSLALGSMVYAAVVDRAATPTSHLDAPGNAAEVISRG